MNPSPKTSPEVMIDDANLPGSATYSPLKKMRSTELRSLYKKSVAIGGLGILAVLYAIGLIVYRLFIAEPTEAIDPFQKFLFFTIVGLCLFMMLATWLRPAWGQTVGYLVCGVLLLYFFYSFDFFALGFSIIGFSVLATSTMLFGRNRVTHSIVKRNYLRRKKEGRFK